MLRNYFRIAIRNMQKYSLHTLLNITGLAIALAACLVIFLVLKHEYSYDTYHKNVKQTYLLAKKSSSADGDNFDIGITFPAIRALRNDFPNLKFGELFSGNGSQVTVMTDPNTTSNKKFIEEKGVFYVDPELLTIFDISWLAGNEQVLKDPGKVALAKSEATKYFGDWHQAIGKYLKIDNTILIQVAGIFDDVPSNSDFPFRILPSIKTFLSNANHYDYLQIDNWGSSSSNHQVYAQLSKNISAASIDKQLPSFCNKYYSQTSNSKTSHFLLPLKDIHFDTRFSNNGDHVSSKTSLHTLSFIGLLILLMACINFINLSTALAVKKSKEVGIRKVMGSSKSQLRWQVLFETGLIVFVSTLLAIGLSWLCLPYLRFIADIQQELQFFSVESILFLVLIVVATTVLSGTYPSIVLSSFKAVEAIKNKINTTRIGGLSLRRILVVLQFTFSQLLIIATIIAVSQMNFIRRADLGINKEAVLMLQGNGDSLSLSRQYAFKADLMKLAGIQSVTFAHDAPSSNNNWTSNFSFDNLATDQNFNTNMKFGDENYPEVFGLKMAAGKFYTDSDSLQKVVINETMVHKLGLKDPETAIGKNLKIGGMEPMPVIGVVKDFHNNSLREEIKPTIILSNKKFSALTAIKLKSRNLGAANEKVRQLWEKHYPEYAYNSIFLDESINNFYKQEERLSRLYKIYAALAILISCLGLYGLVSFMAIQKNKEVGIRKVLGASIANILFLFSKEFTILILIAFLIAAPVGWYMMNTWLHNFVFKINIGLSVFLLALMVSLVIAWITVGYKALHAATVNPVNSLKSE